MDLSCRPKFEVNVKISSVNPAEICEEDFNRTPHSTILKNERRSIRRISSGKREPSSSTANNEHSFEPAVDMNEPAQYNALFDIDIPKLGKLNINIPKKRTIDMLDQEDSTESLEEESAGNLLTCPVCFEEYNCNSTAGEPVFLECHHSICRSCLLTIFQKHPEYHKCPLCRAHLSRKKCIQKNFYVVSMLKNKRMKTLNQLTVWCKDCQTIAKQECSSHEFQEVSEAVSYVWNTNNDLWTSLTGIIADLSQSCKLSRDASGSVLSDLKRSTGELFGVILGIEHMFDKLLEQKRTICGQMDTIQAEVGHVEPYIRRFNDIVLPIDTAPSGEGPSDAEMLSEGALQQTSDHEKRVRQIRPLPHERKVILAKQIRAVINLLIEIEKYSNKAVNNREELNAAIAKINTEQIRSLVKRKIDAMMQSVERAFKDFDPALDQNVDIITL